MRFPFLVGPLLLLAALCGCGGQEVEPKKKQPLTAAEEQEVKTLVDALRQQVQIKKEVVEVLKTVGNRQSMQRALDALDKLTDKAGAATREVSKLRPSSDAVQEVVKQDPVSVEWENLCQAEIEQLQRINKLSDGADFFKAVEALKKTKSP